MSAVLNSDKFIENSIVQALTNEDTAPLHALLAGGVSLRVICSASRKHKIAHSPITREIRQWNQQSQPDKISTFSKDLFQQSTPEKASHLLSCFLEAGGLLPSLPLSPSPKELVVYFQALNKLADKNHLRQFIRDNRDNGALINEVIRQDDVELLKLIISIEAINSPVLEGNPPLHLSCRYRTKKCTAYLLDKGADLNLPGRQQMTPLHYAVLVCDLETAHLLTTRGADPTRKDLNDETPYSLPLRLGNRRVAFAVFKKWPLVIEAFKRTGNFDSLKADLIKEPKRFVGDVFPLLELPFLLQDSEWIQKVAKTMPQEEYERECQHLRRTYSGASFTVLDDARLSIAADHIIELGALASKTLPERQILQSIDLTELLVLFDQINLSKPDQPGYRNPATVKDSNGRSYTASELRDKLETLISEVSCRVPKAGIPPLDQSGIIETLQTFSRGLNNDKKEICSPIIDGLIDYLTPDQISPPLDPLVDQLKEVLSTEESNTLAPHIEKMRRFDHWYQQLEDTLKAILLSVKQEEFDDAVPTLLELALAGGNCGGWTLGDAQKIHQQKTGIVHDLRTQILLTLNSLYQNLLDSFVSLQDNQNRHERTKIQSNIEKHFGIRCETAQDRPHFLDPLSRLKQDPLFILESFKKNYTPSIIIKELNEALNGENPVIDRELLVDWAKEHIPETWNSSLDGHTYLGEHVFDLETGKIKRSYLIFMLTELKILILN